MNAIWKKPCGIIVWFAALACGGSSDTDAGTDVAEAADDGDGAVDVWRWTHRCPDVGGGGPGRCVVVDRGALGACGSRLGFVFDGRFCREVEGCPGDVPSENVFEDELACVRACAEEGWCAIQGPPPDLVCPGMECHDILFCIRPGAPEGTDRVSEYATCHPIDGWECRSSGVGCTAVPTWDLPADLLIDLCTMSLLSEVEQSRCNIYL
jgi:hypothetical protein